MNSTLSKLKSELNFEKKKLERSKSILLKGGTRSRFESKSNSKTSTSLLAFLKKTDQTLI